MDSGAQESVKTLQEITIIVETNSAGVLPLYSGLRAATRRNALRLRYAPWGKASLTEYRPGILWIEVDTGRTDPVFVCFDMHDSGNEYLTERLEQCDFYFKRSFDPAHVARLPPALATKVKPFGLFCRFMDRADFSLFTRIICEWRARARAGRPVGRRELSWWLLLLASSWLYMVLPSNIRTKLVLHEDVLMRSASGLGTGVFFQTRVWDPDEAPEEKEILAINHRRAETVRALRRRFGRQFVGGLLRSPYALERYPELMTPCAQDRLSYLGLLQRSRVSIVTGGVHGSIPGKMAESLAAGRCIVAEPLVYELPVPLQEGTHYLSFRTPGECVAACERMLSDDTLAAAMQSANREYYGYHAAAESAMQRCLTLVADAAPTHRVV